MLILAANKQISREVKLITAQICRQYVHILDWNLMGAIDTLVSLAPKTDRIISNISDYHIILTRYVYIYVASSTD